MKKLLYILPAVLLCGWLLGSCAGTKQPQDLSPLSDDELFETVYFQTIALVDSYPSESAALESIPVPQKTFYILSIYDMEIQNGGLCQFFVNSSEALASQVDTCLETLGAEEHRTLFATFVEDNGIDVNDLSSFRIDDIQDFVDQTQRFDFDSFDTRYYALPPLYTDLIGYIRANLSEFV